MHEPDPGRAEPLHAPDAWRGILAGPQGRLTLGLTFITLSVATESLIITTIMPAIVRDLGGVAFYGLAFSAFFLAGLAAIPTAGWAIDRYGPAYPFATTITLFVIGTAMAALAPNMPILVVARAVQGYGAAAQFTITQATIARGYPAQARVRVLSVISATWTVPGLLGPALGAAITNLFGWRWAFGAILAPAVLAAAITYPRLRAVPSSGSRSIPLAIRLPFQLAVGAGLFIAGLTSPSWWAVPLLAIGVAIAMDALRRTLPAGSLRAHAGLPAIVASSFFLSAGFYAASSFVPLILVGVRSVSITVAGLAVSAGTLSWTLGVWLNTLLVDRIPRSVLIASSTTLMAAGIVGLASAIYGAPLLVAYATWPLAGIGMGVAFNTLTLNTMSAAPIGREGAALASRNLTGNLGIAIGTGIGGAAVAGAEAAHLGLRSGLAFTYAFAVVSALITAALAHRAAKISDDRMSA
jgi:MFS family permease